MRKQMIAAGLCLLAFASAPSIQAEHTNTLRIGTSPEGSATYGMGNALLTLLEDVTPLQGAIQPQSGTGVMIPLIDAGDLDIGFANAIEVTNAYAGEGAFAPTHNENLRLIARLMPLRVGLFVPDGSAVQSIADLRGMRVPFGFTSAPVLNQVITALLANGGLTPEDIQQVPVPSIIAGMNEFAAGNTDVGFFAVGAGKVSEVDATLGGIRFLPLSLDSGAIRRMHQVVPVSYPFQVAPAPNLAGIHQPTPVMAYDYLIFAGAHVREDVIETITEAIAGNQEHLANSFGLFRFMVPRNMATDLYDIPYHPGAVRYYRGAGMMR